MSARDLVVAHEHAALADRTHRELGPTRHADLAHDDHVDRGAEQPSHLGRHRNTAARQADDDDVSGLHVAERTADVCSEPAPGIGPVDERHRRPAQDHAAGAVATGSATLRAAEYGSHRPASKSYSLQRPGGAQVRRGATGAPVRTVSG